jgi:hypothetical protein
MTRIAICVWGICRSSDKTIESVRTNIIQPLHEAGIETELFLHTYTLYRPYENLRAGELKLQLKNSLWKLFQPVQSIVEDQDSVDKTLQLHQYRTMGNPWKEEDGQGFQTLDNHIRALWSLYQVTQLWLPNQSTYDAVMYIRPDVLFLSKIHIEWIQSLSAQTIGIPSFHLIDGVNDRFAVGRPSVMKHYGTRFLHAKTYADKLPLHSEQFLSWILSTTNIHVTYIPIKFRRIRANGVVCEADKEIGLVAQPL